MGVALRTHLVLFFILGAGPVVEGGENKEQVDRTSTCLPPSIVGVSSSSYLISVLIGTPVEVSLCGLDYNELRDSVIDELGARGETEELIRASDMAPSNGARLNVLLALYGMSGPGVTEFMRQHVSTDRTEIAYYATNYLAKMGDMDALRILHENYWAYPVWSLQWATTVRLFGKHAYMPAVPTLITSLDAANANVGQAAWEALSEIFPMKVEPCSMREAQKQFGEAYEEYLAAAAH